MGDDIAEALAGETAVWVECPGLLLAVGQGHLQRQAAVLQEDDVIEHGARQRWLEIRDGRVRTAEAEQLTPTGAAERNREGESRHAGPQSEPCRLAPRASLAITPSKTWRLRCSTRRASKTRSAPSS